MRMDRAGTDNGCVSLEIASTSIVVGTRYTMTVIYTAGPQNSWSRSIRCE